MFIMALKKMNCAFERACPPLHSGLAATGYAALPCSTAFRTKPFASFTRH